MTCAQAAQLHDEKLAACAHPKRRVTPPAYIYTCRFTPWFSIERVGRGSSFSDRIYIRRDRGRIWLRYDAIP
jgi:hypothetical protein